MSRKYLDQSTLLWRTVLTWTFALSISLYTIPISLANSGGLMGAVPVELVNHEGRFALYRDGHPYHIRGVGMEPFDLERLVAYGGNSIRTWRIGGEHGAAIDLLDEAQQRGVTVALCIEIGYERHGFDYDDEAAVAEQFEYARSQVLKYKDHPALLFWIIGNEINLSHRNPRVFDAVNQISKMVHEIDGKHPTTTTLAGFSADLAERITERSGDLDFASVQLYRDLDKLDDILAGADYNKPVMITEWGTNGHWEVEKTAWGAPLELSSSEKAAKYLDRYETVLSAGNSRIIGSYAFLWGQKQERTPTWYGMFLADGAATEAVDVMYRNWMGQWPDNRTPYVESLALNGQHANESVTLSAGGKALASVVARDPDGDPLQISWQLMHESKATQEGGDKEHMPATVTGAMRVVGQGKAEMTVPGDPGYYRLFVYIYDGQGHAGHINLPFRVTASGGESE